MMGNKQSQNQQFEGIDEHDLPTEPGRPIMPPAYDATVQASPSGNNYGYGAAPVGGNPAQGPAGNNPAYEPTLPAGINPYSPQPSIGYPDGYQEEQPAPKMRLPAYPDAQPAPYPAYPAQPQQYPVQQAQYPVSPYPAQPYQGQQQQQYPVPQYPYPVSYQQSPVAPRSEAPAEYPILPPARGRGLGGRRKRGDTDTSLDAVPKRSSRVRSGRGTGFRTSSIPGLVKFFLGLVQLLLIARFILKLLSIPATAYGWVGPVYAISSVFILPIQQFLSHVNLPFQPPVEAYTLVAIIFYWLVSRLVVALLKALF